MSQKDWDKASEACARFYPASLGYKTRDVYWYTAEDGSTIFGIVYFYNYTGDTVKLPVTAWKSTGAHIESVVYDALHPHLPYPLYDLDALVQHRDNAKYVLICQNEKTVEYFKKNHGWMWETFKICPTTYSAIEGTDWGVIGAAKLIVFPENTTNGCREAFKLSKVLHEIGLTPRFVKRTKKDIHHDPLLDQDATQMTRKDGECSLVEFAEHCQREFGVTPPAGILPQAVSLLSLPEDSGPPEFFLEGLLKHRELMMLFASRGVGKSLFAFSLPSASHPRKRLSEGVYVLLVSIAPFWLTQKCRRKA